MLFANLYEPDVRDRAIFGDAYCGPTEDVFPHGTWVTVARFEKDPQDGDGQPVEVDEMRMPARFFRLRVLGASNSVGERKAGFTLTTGSGDDVAKLIVALAKQVAQGMVGLEPERGGAKGCRALSASP